MPTNYFLIKRNPDFTTNGVITKRKTENKLYSETSISWQARKPASAKLAIGDVIYVAETGYAIYAKCKVTRINKVREFINVEEILDYINKNDLEDDVYWMDKLKRLQKKKNESPKASLKYQEYFVGQNLLDRTIPLTGSMEAFRNRNSFIQLKPEHIKYINKPIYEEQPLSPKIPSVLRMKIYSFLNKKYAHKYWIDIDHFIPKSAGGPGNILENLVPVGMSLNRYKSNSIPQGFFEVAKSHEELKKFVSQDFLQPKTKEKFLKLKKAIEQAKKINAYISKNYNLKMSKKFYFDVLERHLPEYAKIIEAMVKI